MLGVEGANMGNLDKLKPSSSLGSRGSIFNLLLDKN